MSEGQLDLFAGAGFHAETSVSGPVDQLRLDPATLGDGALIDALPRASLADCRALAAETVRRRLLQAIPALGALCRRFKGFGVEHAVPEQTAALAAFAAIGGREAADAVAQVLADHVVQGPGLRDAVAVAARLSATVPRDVLVSLLRHAAPEIRADACRCARPWPEVVTLVVELLSDLNDSVARAAAFALGRMGRPESLPVLLRLLRETPSTEAIEAVSGVANDECLVLLGRVARTRPDLAETVLSALDSTDAPRAAQIAAAVRRSAAQGE